MTTLTIKINERTKTGKAFIAMTKNLVRDSKSIEILKSEPENVDIESQYNQDFVAMVLGRYNNLEKNKLTRLNPKDLWGNIL